MADWGGSAGHGGGWHGRGEGFRGELQVRADVADDVQVGNEGHELAEALAARAREGVDGKHAAQEL